MALVTSESEGSSVEAEASAVAEDDSMSSEAELVPGEWLRACSKCSFQRNRTSSSFSHGEPSALFILTGLERVCLPEICLITGEVRISGCIGQLSCLTIFSTSLSVAAFLRRAGDICYMHDINTCNIG